jgi:hypothetical protein
MMAFPLSIVRWRYRTSDDGRILGNARQINSKRDTIDRMRAEFSTSPNGIEICHVGKGDIRPVKVEIFTREKALTNGW